MLFPGILYLFITHFEGYRINLLLSKLYIRSNLEENEMNKQRGGERNRADKEKEREGKRCDGSLTDCKGVSLVFCQPLLCSRRKGGLQLPTSFTVVFPPSFVAIHGQLFQYKPS